MKEGRYKPKSAVTWGDARAAFLESMEAAPDRTYSSYFTAINALERHCKIDRLAELTTARLKWAAEQWLKLDKLSPETVASYLRHIRAMLNWAKRAELLNDAPSVTMPKRQKGDKLMKGRPITGEEFDRLLGKIEAGIIATATAKPKTKTKGQRTYSADARQKLQERMAKRAAGEAPEYRRLLTGFGGAACDWGKPLTCRGTMRHSLPWNLAGQGGP